MSAVLALLLLATTLLSGLPYRPAVAAHGQTAGKHGTLFRLFESGAHPRVRAGPGSAACVPGPTATPTVTPSPTPRGAATATPTLPTPVTPTTLPSNCVVSASPAEAFNIVGAQHTFTFLCGQAASNLTGPSSAPYPATGCFDVTATVLDITAGATASIDSGTCGGIAAYPAPSINCSGVANPICAVGYTTAGCTPTCPTGFSYTGPGCTSMPSGVPAVCPKGSKAITNTAGTILYCLAPQLFSPTASDEATVTFSAIAPHAYMVDITGFVGTTPAGTCPSGTTLVPSVLLTSTLTGPACAFEVRAEKKYIEADSLTIQPGQCTASSDLTSSSFTAGTPCFFTVTATGTVTLKTGVNCTDGSEPASGTDATSLGFPAGSVFLCSGSTLAVTHVPIPKLPINLSAVNGFFNPTCAPPQYLATATPATPQVITPGPPPTATPTSTVVPSPTTPPSPPFVCSPPGPNTEVVVTNENGIAGQAGTEVEYRAIASPSRSQPGNDETITGQFLQDGVPIPGVAMYATFHFPDMLRYCRGATDATGTAQCTLGVPNTPPGTQIPVDATFIYDCTQYTTEASFTVGTAGLGTPTATPIPGTGIQTAQAPAGICVIRTGFGPVTVEASITSSINTQPAISSGPVTIGNIVFATSTPVFSPTPTETPTETPVPTETPTVTETPTATDTPTPIPSPTETPIPPPTPTSTPIPGLRFTVDAVRVSKQHNPGNMQGLDVVRRGQRVWLMVYYTIHSFVKKQAATHLYTIHYGKRLVFSASVPIPKSDMSLRRFTRYLDYAVPKLAPYGVYDLRVKITIGKKSRSGSWRFIVARLPSGAP